MRWGFTPDLARRSGFEGVVDLLITDLAVFEIDRRGGGAVLTEMAPGVTLDELRACTEANFKVALKAA